MVPWRSNEEGLVTKDVIEWYQRFAEGKPGAIVVEATGIRDIPSGPLLRIGHDRYIDGLKRLTAAIHEASKGETKCFIQLIDFLNIKRRPPKDKFFNRFLKISDDIRKNLVATTKDESWTTADETTIRTKLLESDDDFLKSILSKRELEDYLFGYRERVWDLHLEHIKTLPQILPGLFADAAERAFKAGFDGVELHYAHAYTMASFLSALNNRDDGFGGSPENRVKVPKAVLEEVRKRIGPDACLGLRFLGDDVVDGGLRIEDAMYYAHEFVKSGADFISVSKGGKFEDAKQPKVGDAAYPYTGQSGYECMPTVFSDKTGPFGRNVKLSATIKSHLNGLGHDVPIVTSGGICNFDIAESILQKEEADIVASARQSLADPDWFLKTRLGKGNDIRQCEYTNYCEGLDQKHKQVTCKLWDRKELDQPGISLDFKGKRRLVAPPWKRE